MSHKVPRLGLGGVRDSDSDMTRGESPRSPERRSSPSPGPKPQRRPSAQALPSPKAFKHETSRGSVTPRRSKQDQQVINENLSCSVGGAPNECKQLEVFESQEVRELIAVGDKVWTAERRSPNVIIRNAITGTQEQVVSVPRRSEFDQPEIAKKEHVFPWSMLHVKFFVEDTTRGGFDSPGFDTHDSGDEETIDNRSLSRASPVVSPVPSALTGRKASTMSLEGRSTSMSKRRASLNGSPLKRGLSSRGSMYGKGGSGRSQVPPSATPNTSFGGGGLSPRGPGTPVAAANRTYVDEVWVGYSDGTIRSYDSTTGEVLAEMKEQGGGIYCLTLYDCYIYSGSNDWTIRKWDATTRTIVGQFLPGKDGHSNSIRAVDIAEEYLVSGSDDFTIRLWDHIYVGKGGPETGTGRCVRILHGHKASVLTLTYCDGRLWSGSEDATVMVWDINGDRTTPIKQLTDTRHVVTKLIALPKISRVLCCSVDNVVRVYDSVNMVLVSNLKGHTGFVHSCAPVGVLQRYVVWSTSQDQTIRAWSVAGYDRLQSTSPLIQLDEDYERKRVKFQLRDSERRCEEMQRRLADKEKEGREQTRKLAQLENDKSLLEDELDRLRDELNDYRADKDTGRAALNDRERELERSRRQQESVVAENRRMRDELERLTRDLAGALDDVRSANSRNDLYKTQVDSLRDDINNMQKERGAASSIAQLEEDARKALKFEKDLLESQVRQLEDNVLDLRESNKRKLLQLQHAEAHLLVYEQLHAAAAPLIEQYHYQKKRMVRFEEYEGDAGRVPGLIDEVEALKARLKDALAGLKEKDGIIDELRYQNSCMSPQGKKDDEILEHIRQKGEMRDEILDLRDQVDKLGRQLKDVQGEKRAAETTLESLAESEKAKDSVIQGLKDELAKLNEALDAQRAAHSEALEKLGVLEEDAECWEGRLNTLRDEVAAKTDRVQRGEDVLADMRRRQKELEGQIQALEQDNHALKSELQLNGEQERVRSDEMRRLADELMKLRGEQREEFKFILQSRTDFIQAVYDWLLCSAMSRRYAKKLDLNSPASKDALQQAVEGAYKRGHYILSNYVSEIEKHHLGVSPSLYPADPVLQQMFSSRRADVTGFLRNMAKNEPTTINRVDILATPRCGGGGDAAPANDGASSRVRSPRRAHGGSPSPQANLPRKSSGSAGRSFTPPAAYRRAHSAAEGVLQSAQDAAATKGNTTPRTLSRAYSPPNGAVASVHSTARSGSMGKKKTAAWAKSREREALGSPLRRAMDGHTDEHRSPRDRNPRSPPKTADPGPRIFPSTADGANTSLTFKRAKVLRLLAGDEK
eukprot:TRINITY_DN9694_c0_g1_i2.p1 TRINITY_DN9694_c0_g1~~TRINITY_DN9694_c0_g1_i2.p1  ORF type:complete len:1318 (+),score=495.11 TRINITY_DN9694_c0_g1_i2:98-4051(+)